MYAVIDIGSNTIRLSLYSVENGTIIQMLNKKITAGLAGYTQNGRMSEEGIEKGEEALKTLSTLLSHIKIQRLVCFATASLRGIDNAGEVKARFEQIIGTEITILSGEEEAEIDYFGAKQTFLENEGLLVDIGGGSTEIACFKDDKLVFSRSIPVGSLIMYRKHVKDVVPTKFETLKIDSEIQRMLKTVFAGETIQVKRICGIGGTVRGCGNVLSALMKDKTKKEMYLVNDISLLMDEKKRSRTDIILKNEPERIHTLLPGVCILYAVAAFFGAESIRVSKTGVREGYLAKLLAEEKNKREVTGND
ncbi:MAG TPA: hypothetical protein O0X39_02535 [Methanocorpusculum sp.]|nr:hypothetical protein [Methanocorpusculum sp.]